MEVDVAIVMIDTEEIRVRMNKSIAKQFPVNQMTDHIPSVKFKVLTSTLKLSETKGKFAYFSPENASWYTTDWFDWMGSVPPDVPLVIL